MKRDAIRVTMLFFCLTSGWGSPAVTEAVAVPVTTDGRLARDVEVNAQTNSASPSSDHDYDGLTDDVETNGWWNAAGLFITGPHDSDSDNDGLTDGEEKLYDTNPLDGHSPGIYVEYEDHLRTRQYFAKDSHSVQPWGWQQYGDRLISFDAVVVRQGSTFSVGGPADATIRVNKSLDSLTTLTLVWDACRGRWRISVPPGGTVGKYEIVLQDGAWSKRLNLYVIFELPTPTSGFTQAMIDTFLYDDDPTDLRDEKDILLGDYEYTHNDYPDRIPSNAWINAGSTYRFELQEFEPFVFEEHVIEAINGQNNQWDAAQALVARADKVTRYNNPRVLYSSWSVLHPGTDDSNQCSNIAGLLTAFARSAGIPARALYVDWVHASFDHATEMWLNDTWYVARAFRGREPACGWDCGYGYYPLQSRYDWGRDTYVPWHSGGTGNCSTIMAADENWTWSGTNWVSGPTGHEYRWPSWDWDAIVRYNWFDSLFVPYWSHWGWNYEPYVTGSPPNDWPSLTGYAMYTASDSHTITEGNVTAYTGHTSYLPIVMSSVSSSGTVDDGQASVDVRGVDDYGVDLDRDGYFDELVIELEANATQAGTYWFQGQLGIDRAVPSLMGTGGLVAAAVVHADLAQGTNIVRLPFEGLRISAGKIDGPYVLQYLSVTDVDNPGPDEFANEAVGHWMSLYTTASYRAYDFQNWGAALSGQVAERGLDTDSDALYESLILDVGVDIFEPGTYTVRGDLYDSRERFVARATWSGAESTAVLRFDGLSDAVGPYTLQEISLLNADDELIDSMVGAYTTQEVIRADRGTHIVERTESGEVSLQGILPGPYTDGGLDLDGDGLYDLLAIDVQVEMEQTGQYRLEGWLGGGEGALISWAASDSINVTTVGTYTLSLAFSGPAISAHNTDGPFTLTALTLLRGAGYEVVDEVDVAYTTASDYTPEQFERLPYLELPADHVVLFEDHLESGEGNWTADSPWALTTAQSHSPVNSWTDSPGGNYANRRDVSLTSVPIALWELSRPMLQFQTCYDLEANYDYGYVEISTDGGVTWHSVATYTGNTVHWSREVVDLGVIGDAETLRVRFRLNTDGGVTADGWYVDNVALYFDRDLSDNLQGYWTLDQASSQRLDSSGRGNHLIDHNMVGAVAGQVGLAADFESDGNAYLSIDDAAQNGLDVTGSLTLVGWMKAAGVERWQVMAAKGELGSGNWAYSLDLQPGNILGFVVSPDGTTSNEYSIEASPPFSLHSDTWYHVAGVFDAGQKTLAVYLDGALIASRLVSYDIIHDSSAPFMLGTNLEDGQVTQHFDGQLDEWYVFSQALSKSEIEDLMALAEEPISSLTATNDSPTVLGNPTTLTASITSGSNVTYLWNFGDGSPLDGSGPVVSHIYPAVGTFTVVVTASNGINSQTAATAVSIQASPVAAFSTSSPDCLGEATSFTNSSGGGNLSFEWDFGDGSPIETAVHPSHTYATTGTFAVVLTATNSIGSDAASAQVIIEDLPTIPPDLRGYWTLDEVSGRRLDGSGWGNHLTDNNTVGSAAGQVGLAADLESGNSEYLSIGDAVQHGLDITGSLTLAGWVNAESLSSWQVLAAKYDLGVNTRAYRLDLRYDNLVAFIVSPDGTVGSGNRLEASPPSLLRAGTWYHVAAVFDAERRSMSVYLNGDLIGSRSVTYSTIYNSPASFMLGANQSNGQATQYFDGRLDEWRVYSRALTESEIEELMALAPPGLLVYPYLGETTTTSVVISWATDGAGAGEVRHSLDQSYSNVVTAVSSIYDGKYWHSATITGLTADTIYYYRIYTDGSDVTPWSAITFTTAPGATVPGFTFGALGDSRPDGASLPPNQGALDVAAEMARHSFDLVVHMGDLVSNGGICSGADSAWNQYIRAYFDLYREIMGSVPFYPSVGNHEMISGDCGYQAYTDVYYLPENASPGDEEEYYSFDWGNAHFVALDTNQSYSTGSAQYNWLVNDLQTSTQPWKFVFFHQPAYSSGPHGSTGAVQNYLVPIFETYGVDIVFNGDDHQYERTCPILDDACTTLQGGGVVYYVTGGGGASLYSPVGGWFTAYRASLYHFLEVEVNDCWLRVNPVRTNGNVFDSYEINHCGSSTRTVPVKSVVAMRLTTAVVPIPHRR